MLIDWKVIKSKKLIRGRAPGFDYEVKHHRGNGWVGKRFHIFSHGNGETHKVGPFKSKFDCMKCLETIDALVTPALVDPYKRFREYQKMYVSGVNAASALIQGAKK